MVKNRKWNGILFSLKCLLTEEELYNALEGGK